MLCGVCVPSEGAASFVSVASVVGCGMTGGTAPAATSTAVFGGSFIPAGGSCWFAPEAFAGTSLGGPSFAFEVCAALGAATSTGGVGDLEGTDLVLVLLRLAGLDLEERDESDDRERLEREEDLFLRFLPSLSFFTSRIFFRTSLCTYSSKDAIRFLS